ncbi:MAG: 2-amino-4-hydroxy-6-hydroxymethyldihydropteridine diphosphokinase [Acidobacteria bacterium]|nr:2-amino-4-hydroxy-6-hydroxymethyldihydropteridine diphosphokinase [Acidobacteriota bacterium]
MNLVYLSLGSNLGDREQNLAAALAELQGSGLRIRRVSRVYETEPRDYPHQRWFLNLAVEAETSLFPMQLLSRIARIERRLGRRRKVAKGPRPIDIDILFYGRFVVRTAALEIPHPRLAERRFVLLPMLDLVPDLRHPVLRKTIRELAPATAGQAVRLTDFQLGLRGTPQEGRI